ncbi:MAG: phosphate ABC transporter permease subunit PstC [Byssovorax sp.]
MNHVEELPAPEASDDLLGPKAGKRTFLGVPLGDRIFAGAVTFFALLVLAIPGMMLVEIFRASWLAIRRFGLAFLGQSVWDPVHEKFGALPFIHGTVVSSIIALALAVPVSLGLAIFLSELCPARLKKPLGFLVELLAAIPSVVYGFWGVFVLVPLLRETVEPFLVKRLGFLPIFRGEPLGFGMLAAGIILAIMIIPTITSISREVLGAVPSLQREAAIGLGATPWDTIRHAVLPSARSGIVGAIILGLNRALGETMAVTMVIGNRPKVSGSILDPAYSMASVIANEFAEADSDVYLSALSEIALLLLGVALIMNIFARWLVVVTKRRMRQPA